MANAIEEVLSDLGWGDGFRIPIANAENKRLEEEIERKTRLRASLRTQLDATNERIDDIRKHAADVRQEHRQNQRLISAHSAQVEAENRIYKLAQSEESRLAQEIRQNERQGRETGDKIDTLQQTVDRLMKRLEAAKTNIKVDTDRLSAWEERLNQKDEKNAMIEQFVKSDEKTFKKIELERQNLSEKAEVYRQAVIKIVGDAHELESMLDRTARLYTQAIKDRRQLMDQWAQSVQVLTERDKAIYNALQDISMLREIAKERMDAYQEAERFYAIQVAENRELDYSTMQLDKELASLKEEHLKLLATHDAFSIEVHVQRRHLQDLARRTQDVRSNTKRKRIDVQDKQLKMEQCRDRIAELRVTLKNIDGQNMNVEERMMQMQDMLEKEEKRKSDIANEIRRQQTLILRSSMRQKELEGERKMVILRQQAESHRWDQLLEELVMLEKQLRERKDCVYKTDVELQRCEMRLQTVLGQERDKTELEAKQKKLKQLLKTQKERSERLKVMQAQLVHIENEIRKIMITLTNNNENLNRLKNKEHELLIMIESGEKQMKMAQSNYEEKKVEENILMLKLNEAGKMALKTGDKLYNLEKYALQMEAAMQERRSEISVQKENLNLQRRSVLADCAELRNMINERRLRIQQLQSRYEIHIATLGTNPEDGSPMTSTYLIIQSAQERYLLQERGDGLDRAIRKAETEIRSMENTLRLVNVCNDKYKSSLSQVDETAPEKAELRRLDQELFNALELVRQKRQEFENFENDYKRMEQNCAQLDMDIEKIRDDKDNKRQLVMNLEQQITEQKEKILRADKNLRKVLKDIQEKCICVTSETILLQERDIAVRELQEQNTLALQRIIEFMIRHVEAEAYVKKRLADHCIDLPCTYYMKQPLSSSRCETSTGDITTKTSSRLSTTRLAASLKDSFTFSGSIVHFEADFSGLESSKFESSRSSKSSPHGMQKRILKKK